MPGLLAVLVFVGIKMLVACFGFHVPTGLSLGVIGGVLLVSASASLMFPPAVVHDPLARQPPDPVYPSVDPDHDDDTPAAQAAPGSFSRPGHVLPGPVEDRAARGPRVRAPRGGARQADGGHMRRR